MARTALAACLVLSVVSAGCFGIVEPVEPRPSGQVQGSVVSEAPEGATVVTLNSSAVPEDSPVASAVRAAVAEHDRLSGDGTAVVGVNASDLTTAEKLLNELDTTYVRYEGHVVEVALLVEE